MHDAQAVGVAECGGHIASNAERVGDRQLRFAVETVPE